MLGRLVIPLHMRRRMAVIPESVSTTASKIRAAGQQPVVVAYRTPKHRANEALKRSAWSALISLAIVVLGILMAFLQQGDFSRAAMIALAIAVISNVIQAACTWLLKLQSSINDDAKTGVQPPDSRGGA